MRVFLISVLVLCLLTSAAVSQSQTPIPNAPPNSQIEPIGPNGPDGSSDDPIHVRIEPSDPKQDELLRKEEEALRTERVADATDVLAEATIDLANFTKYLAWATVGLVVVALLQLSLFFVQLRAMRQGLRDSSATARATRDTVDSFVSKERARLLLYNPQTNIGIGMQLVQLVGERIWASCNYYNYGDTVALIHQCKLEIIIDRDLPPRPVFKSPGKLIAYGQDPILPGESGGDYRRTLVEPATAEQLAAIASKDVNVFIVGCITFEDIFGVIRTRVGAMKFKDTMFVPTKGASYNFEVEGYYENPEEP